MLALSRIKKAAIALSALPAALIKILQGHYYYLRRLEDFCWVLTGVSWESICVLTGRTMVGRSLITFRLGACRAR